MSCHATVDKLEPAIERRSNPETSVMNVLDEVSGGEWGEIVIWLSFPYTHYSYVQPHRSSLVSPLQKLRGKES
jgi:hypothetical protein